MGRPVLIAVLAVTVLHCYGAAQQLQIPIASELVILEDDFQSQIRELQKNMTDIWTYIHELRTAVSQHLTHLRQHQVELESSVHKLEHQNVGTGDSHTHDSQHGDSHHHSGEQHSHSGEHHSHGGDHSSDHSHSSGHSYGSDHGSDHRSHSGEHHSHSGEHHSHSGEHHGHSGEHHSHSHSHTSHDHGKEDHTHSSHDHGEEDGSHSHDDSHSHGSDHQHDHKDSHETEDLEQQTQQIASETGPIVEPIVVPTTRQQPAHPHPRSHHHGSHGHSHGQTSRSSSSSSNTMDLMNEHSFHHHRSHGHPHDSASRSRNRTVELPKYSDYGMYEFAVCNVQPNRAIHEDQQQNVGGQVTMWQKKSGGPLNLHVRLQGFQMGDHHSHHGAHQAMQQEEQAQDNETPQPEVVHKHGFHVHASGDLSNGCQSTGPHYNPKGVNHGAPTALVRHVGDLGNIECDNHGVTNLIFSDDVASLRGQYSILGKAIVIHSNADDMGLADNPESLKTGNAGTRIACCVIQGVEKLPIRYYKAMKTATQYQNY